MSDFDMMVVAIWVGLLLGSGIFWMITKLSDRRRKKNVRKLNELLRPAHKHNLKILRTIDGIIKIPFAKDNLKLERYYLVERPYLMKCDECGKEFFADRVKFLGYMDEC